MSDSRILGTMCRTVCDYVDAVAIALGGHRFDLTSPLWGELST